MVFEFHCVSMLSFDVVSGGIGNGNGNEIRMIMMKTELGVSVIYVMGVWESRDPHPHFSSGRFRNQYSIIFLWPSDAAICVGVRPS